MNPIPEKLVNFAIYREGETVPLGLADVDLPSFQAMTETTAGAGIAGEVENPVVGKYQSMTLTLNWRLTTTNTTTLAAPMAHSLDIRAAHQYYEAAGGRFQFRSMRIWAKCVPKNTELGKAEPGKMMGSRSEFEINYIKIELDGEVVIEVDKYNFICVVHGVDYMTDIRQILGHNN